MKNIIKNQLKPIELFFVDIRKNQLRCNYSGFKQLQMACDEHLKAHKKAQQNLNESFLVISSVGSIKTGKSTLLNELLRAVNKFYVKDQKDIFSVNETNQAHTKSITACPILMETEFGSTNCIFVDTPGFDSLQYTQQIDKMIFFVVKIISSSIIYNSFGGLDSNLIGRLHGFCKGTQHQYQNDRQNPNLIFLQKDFSLQLLDQNKFPITAKKYLKSFLQNQDYNKNQILQNNFHKIDCHILPIKEADKKSTKKSHQKLIELIQMITLPKMNQLQSISNFFQKIEILSQMIQENSTILTMKEFSKKQNNFKKVKFQQFLIELREKINIFVINVQKQLPLHESLIEFKFQTFEQDCLKKFKQEKISKIKQHKEKIINNFKKAFTKIKNENNKKILSKIKQDTKDYISSLNFTQNQIYSKNLQRYDPNIIERKVEQYGRHLIQNYPIIQQQHVQYAFGTIYREFYRKLYKQSFQFYNKNEINFLKKEKESEELRKCNLKKEQDVQNLQINLKILQSLLQESKKDCQRIKQQKLKDLQTIGEKNAQIIKLNNFLQISNKSKEQIEQKNNSFKSDVERKTLQILQKTIKQKDLIIQNLKKEVDKVIQSQKKEYKEIKAKLDFEEENVQIKSQFYSQRNKELQTLNKKYLEKIKKIEKELQIKKIEYQNLYTIKLQYEQKFQKLQKDTTKMLQEIGTVSQNRRKTIEEYSLKIKTLQIQSLKNTQSFQLRLKNELTLIRNNYEYQMKLAKNKIEYFEENYLRIREQLKLKSENFENILSKISEKQKSKSKQKPTNRQKSVSNSKEKSKLKITPSKRSSNIAESIQNISNLSISKKRKSTQTKFEERLQELQLQRSQIQKKKKMCDKKEAVISKIQKCLKFQLKAKKWNTSQKSNIIHKGLQNFGQQSSILTTSKKYTNQSSIFAQNDPLKQTNMNYIQTEETLPDKLVSKINMPCRKLF